MNQGDVVVWSLSLPRGEKVVRDFVFGNLHLFVECVWPKNIGGLRPETSGRVELRPTDIAFFDSDRRPVSKVQSLLMRYLLWSEDVAIYNTDGVSVRFTAQIRQPASN